MELVCEGANFWDLLCIGFCFSFVWMLLALVMEWSFWKLKIKYGNLLKLRPFCIIMCFVFFFSIIVFVVVALKGRLPKM